MTEITSGIDRAGEHPATKYWEDHENDARVAASLAEERLSLGDDLPDNRRAHWEEALEIAKRKIDYCRKQLGKVARVSTEL